MPSRDNLQRLRSFPRAPPPNQDSSTVISNLPDHLVQLQQNILAYHIAHHPDPPARSAYGSEHAKSLKLVEAYVRPREEGGGATSGENACQSPGTAPNISPDDLLATTVCETQVEEGMLNVHGTLAGACATLLIDLSTFSSLFVLGTVTNIDPSGFSTSMHLVWHAPATCGMTLRLVATSLSLKPRLASARCEVFDKRTGALLVSATQVVSPVQAVVGASPARAARTPTKSGEANAPRGQAPAPRAKL
ncbi:hypothetical protein BD413DRAFT_478496 [Trametes elegans]|nr:hypothetical protein BD413DRAFT_478496 [Trametes elegans]